MIFSSPEFLAFLIIFLGCVYLLPSVKLQTYIVILFSIAFIFFGEGVLVLLYLVFACLTWLVGQAKSWALKLLLILSLLVSLFVVKYLEFFLGSFGFLYVGGFLEPIYLLLGWSFFVFQLLSFLIDSTSRIHKENYPQFQQFMFYSLSFPQLLAGPIVRWVDISKQFNSLGFSKSRCLRGGYLFYSGFS